MQTNRHPTDMATFYKFDNSKGITKKVMLLLLCQKREVKEQQYIIYIATSTQRNR